jgi:DNA-binding GntR family transcriptional regulator
MASIEIPPTVDPKSSSSLVQRVSMTEQTVRALRNAILDGTYSLGQKLRESELVSRFGVSSSVIREALHVLQGEGIVVTRPYCGRSVFSLQPKECEELLTMRASLESYAAYLAAKKMTSGMAERLLAAARRFTNDQPPTYSDWVEREIAFHHTVWEASGNEWLQRQLSQFSLPIFAVRLTTSPGKSIDVQSLWQASQNRETEDNPNGHQAVARTIVSGNAKKAKKLMVKHILPDPDLSQKEMFDIK